MGKQNKPGVGFARRVNKLYRGPRIRHAEKGKKMKRNRKTQKKHLRRLVASLRKANYVAWSTIGRPGPCFTSAEPGPDKDQAWDKKASQCAADREEAAAICFSALERTPEWLSYDKELMRKAYRRAFVGCDGCAACGPGIPSLPDLLAAREYSPKKRILKIKEEQ